MLTVGSLFAGVGGFDLGFERAGFVTRWQVEIDGDCRAVLADRFPSAVRHIDVDAFAYGRAKNRAKHGLVLPYVDVLVGGFPCQDVSVAGKRAGLAGSRTGLFWALNRIIAHVKPKVVVLENVPGLFSSQRGRDFHTVLAALAERGLRRAYRILDSQYFGIPQRRRRVFIVGCARESGLDPDQILFESAGGDGDSSSRQQTRARVASTLRGRSARAGVNEPGRGGEDDANLVVGVHANQRGEVRTSALTGSLNGSRSGKQYEGVAFTLPAVHRGVGNGHNTNYIAGPLGGGNDGIGRRSEDDPNLVYGERERALTGSMWKGHDDDTDTLIPTLDRSLGHHRGSVGVGDFCVASPITASAGHHGHSSPRVDGSDNLIAATLNSGGNEGWFRTEPGEHLNASSAGVRRLTPLECERLQGFPDGHTCRCGADREYRKTLRMVWDAACLRGLSEREARAALALCQSAVLQCALRAKTEGSIGDQGRESFWAEARAAALSAATLPDLRTEGPEASQGRKPSEQRPREHRFSVCVLPREGALEDGHPISACLTNEDQRPRQPWEDCRLEGLTAICTCPDTPRYKQMGNAVSVPVAEWIARRILELEQTA